MDQHLEDLGFDEDTGARKRARALSASRGRSLERKAEKSVGKEIEHDEKDAMEVRLSLPLLIASSSYPSMIGDV